MENKIFIKNKRREAHDILFIVENEKYNYICFKKNNKVNFAKYKENTNILKDVTKSERDNLIIMLDKMSEKE